ncbi:MAG: hypothetical protein LBB98_00330 [Treponema sp.]|nr:hypothetical protein [Treponema sp.]
MNIDYHFEEQSIEAALYRQYSKHFFIRKIPRSFGTRDSLNYTEETREK